MSISEAHRKMGHMAHSAIRHAISNGLIAGIELDNNSKPDFCDACVKAKSTWQPFPKESKTRVEKFGKCVHWDLWGLPLSKALMDTVTWLHKLMMPPANKTVFSRKEKSAFRVIQNGWGLHWNPNWAKNQDILLRLRGRISIYIPYQPSESKRNSTRVYSTWLTSTKWSSWMRHENQSWKSSSSSSVIRLTPIFMERSHEPFNMATEQISSSCNRWQNTI